MPALHKLQQDFCLNIFDPEAGGQILQKILGNGIDPAQRIQIYRNNVYASLTESLRAIYPVIHELVGEGFFNFAAHEYITHYPSTSGDLHEFGDRFGDFLADFEPARSLLYLRDVARLEWFYHEVYHAADHGPLDLQRLAKEWDANAADVVLEMHPAARLMYSRFPVLRIWQVNQEKYDGDQTVDLDAGEEYLLILRPDVEIEFHRLDRGHFMLLQTVSRGVPLAAAVDRVLEDDPDFQLEPALKRFVNTRALVGFHLVK